MSDSANNPDVVRETVSAFQESRDRGIGVILVAGVLIQAYLTIFRDFNFVIDVTNLAILITLATFLALFNRMGYRKWMGVWLLSIHSTIVFLQVSMLFYYDIQQTFSQPTHYLMTTINFITVIVLASFLVGRMFTIIIGILSMGFLGILAALSTTTVNKMDFLLPLTHVGIVTAISAFFTGLFHQYFDQLIQLGKNLKARVEDRTSDLADAKRKAEEANRNKSLFLANISHDLRTPLNSIIGYSEMLRNRVEDPESNRKIKTVYSAANDLKNLIDTLIDVSRIELDEYDIQESTVELPALLNEIENLFRRKASTKDLEFETSVNSSLNNLVHLDERAIKQVLYNLLDNAIKYTETGSVRIRIETLNSSDQAGEVNLKIEIEDTGRGISEDELKTIFEIFDQGKQSDVDQVDGFGLGLYICNELIDAMGGTLDVESELGEGSLFRIELPGVPVVQDEYNRSFEEVDEGVEQIDFADATVLIIDDNSENREIFAGYLKELELSSIEASNGEGGVERALDENPDLILLDIRMKDMDGYETFERLRNHQGTKEIPIIAVTAHATGSELDKINQYNFDGILVKPIKLPDFTLELMNHLDYEGDFGSSEDENRGNTIELSSDDILEDLPSETFRETLNLYKKSTRTRNLDAVRDFAGKIRSIATSESNDSLSVYSRQLLEAVDTKKFVRIDELLDRFELLVDPLKERLN